MRRILIVMTIMTAISSPAAARDATQSGNDLIEPCRAVATGSAVDNRDRASHRRLSEARSGFLVGFCPVWMMTTFARVFPRTKSCGKWLTSLSIILIEIPTGYVSHSRVWRSRCSPILGAALKSPGGLANGRIKQRAPAV
jgi:hypothetical protein